MKIITEIRTVIQTNAELFDKHINSAMASGFELERYGVERISDNHSKLVAFLVKKEEVPEEAATEVPEEAATEVPDARA